MTPSPEQTRTARPPIGSVRADLLVERRVDPLPRIHSMHVIGTRGGGGAERFFTRLVSGLADLGAPVFAVTRPGSPIRAELEGRVPQRQFGMRNGLDVFSMAGIWRLLGKVQPDIVQTYMGRASRMVRVEGRKALLVGRLGNYYRTAAYGHCDAWIANTRGIRDYLVDHGFPRERVFQIYNLVEVRRPPEPGRNQARRERWRLPQDALVLVALGRFAPIKGFGGLLEAFARVPREIDGRPVHLLLLGDGQLAGELRTQAESLGVSDRVRFTGWQPDPTPDLFLADLVVFPPRVEEPFGNVTFEAWAHGRPLLATDFLGARELLNHGQDAWVVPCGDPPALAAGIERLLRDRDLRYALAREGLRRVHQEFSKRRIVAEYLGVWETLIRLGPR